jgi:lysozyme
MDREALKAQLRAHEGLRLRPYLDVVGVWTAGYGHNLTANGISLAVAELMLDDDVDVVLVELAGVPWFAGLSDVRQLAVADLVFNLGLAGLRSFVRFISALKAERYSAAARELEDSRWYRQVGVRGPQIVKMIETGLNAEA